MSLQDKLSTDLHQAMKTRERLRMEVLRMIKAAIQYKELELHKTLDDAELTRIMTTLIKQRKEAADHYQIAKREHLASKELQEITIIESYLPQPLSGEEVGRIIDTVIQETGAQGPKDLGVVMKITMTKLSGRPVDGKHVNGLVRAKLQSSSH